MAIETTNGITQKELDHYFKKLNLLREVLQDHYGRSELFFSFYIDELERVAADLKRKCI